MQDVLITPLRETEKDGRRKKERKYNEERERGAEEKKAQSEKDLWNSRREALHITYPSSPGQKIPNLGKKKKNSDSKVPVSYILET